MSTAINETMQSLQDMADMQGFGEHKIAKPISTIAKIAVGLVWREL